MSARPCLFASLVVVFITGVAHAQCCSPGNPIGGGGVLGVLPSGEGRLIANYAYSRSGTYMQGSEEVEPFFVESGFFHHASLNGAYAISNYATIESELTYFISKVQEYVEGSRPSSRRGFGVGDWSATLHVSLLGGRQTRTEITTGAGLKVPIGTYRQKRGGGLLPLDIQPTTGAVDFIHEFFVYRGFLDKGLHLFAVNRIEWKTSNPDGYRYGNLYATSLFASVNLGLQWVGGVQARTEIRGRDRRPSGRIPVTGSTKLYITPQVSFALTRSLAVTVLADLPVYQRYNGGQLGSTGGFSVGLIRNFGRGKPVDGDTPPLFR